MTDIFDIFRKKNPKVAILLVQCYQEWAPLLDKRTAMKELAKIQTIAESPIVIVDHSADWVSSSEKKDTTTVDWTSQSGGRQAIEELAGSALSIPTWDQGHAGHLRRQSKADC